MSTFEKTEPFGDDAPVERAPDRRPIMDRLTVPPLSEQDMPSVVRCCPCGREVVVKAIAAGPEPDDYDSIDCCPEHGICEGVTVCVPVDVYEIGPETTLAWIKAHREDRHGAA